MALRLGPGVGNDTLGKYGELWFFPIFQGRGGEKFPGWLKKVRGEVVIPLGYTEETLQGPCTKFDIENIADQYKSTKSCTFRTI